MRRDEQTLGRQRRAASRYALWQRVTARAVLLAFLFAPAVQAGNTTSTKATGDVTTASGDADLTVDTDTHTQWTQNSETLIQNYHEDLKQAKDHHLEYVQEPDGRALLRFPGITDTEFWGSFSCTGTCVVANSAGVHFRDGSFVDVGKLIALSGDITNDDFLGDIQQFTIAPGGHVTNDGTILGGSVALIGDRVANFGHIAAPGGALFMLSGDQVIQREHGSPIIIRASLPSLADGTLRGPGVDVAAVENAGTIDVTGGRARMAAGDMLSLAIRNSGEIKAARIELEAGDEGYVEVTGMLDASALGKNDVGGHVEVLGDFVAIRDGAVIDASGGAGGGEVLIGGDESGQGDARHARVTYIDPNAEIRADALNKGDGGRIIVWSDEATQTYGKLSARGGARGGDGGFIETSSYRLLDTLRAPDVSAPAGRAGTWLIDPNNIRIVDGCEPDTAPQCMDQGLGVFYDPAFGLRPSINDSQVSVQALEESLADGTEINITTHRSDVIGAEGGQVGDIVIEADIIIAEDAEVDEETISSLNLFAANDIRFEGENRKIENTNSDLELSIWLRANDTLQPELTNIGNDGLPYEYQGSTTVNADITTGGGRVLLDGVNVELVAGHTIDTNGGNVNIVAFGGDAIIAGTIDTSVPRETGPLDEILPAGGSVIVNAQSVATPEDTSDDSPIASLGGNIVVDSGDVTKPAEIITEGGAIQLGSIGGNVTVNGDLDTVKADALGGGSITLNAQRAVADGEPDDVAFLAPDGGSIILGEKSRVYTGGGALWVGRFSNPDGATNANLAWKIIGQGKIDTRRMTDWVRTEETSENEYVSAIDWFEGQNELEQADVVDAESVGGSVLLKTYFDPITGIPGDGITFDGSTSGGFIKTQGGLVVSESPVPEVKDSGGDFSVIDYTIDTRRGTELEETDGASSIILLHRGSIDVSGDSQLLTDGTILLSAGLDGTANISLGADDPTDSVTLQGQNINLFAGDGYTPGSTLTASRIEIGAAADGGTDGVLFKGAGDTPGNPEVFRFVQDASIGSEEGDSTPPTAAHFELGGDSSGMEFDIAARDGTISMDVGSLIAPSTPGEAPSLLVSAASGVVFQDAGGIAAGLLDTLDIAVAEDLTVDTALAGAISGAAPTLRIRAGALGNSLAGNLIVAADLDATSKLVLQAGASGTGDLTFESAARLDAETVVLRAGDGRLKDPGIDPSTYSSVDATREVSFSSNVRELQIWQDRSIDDGSVPELAQFEGTLPPGEFLAYGLRSDLGSITLDTSVDRLADTDLSLHAFDTKNPILLESALSVRSLDIGGIDDFMYTRALAEKIFFSDPGSSKLVLRAGIAALDGGADLTFEDQVVVEADEIRLVAGDGVGASGRIGINSSRIDLSGAETDDTTDGVPIFRNISSGQPVSTFVYRQDAAFTSEDLPSLTSFDGQSPLTYGIRSDYRPDPTDITTPSEVAFTITDFESDKLPIGQHRLVISAPELSFERTDGLDLDLGEFSTDSSAEARPPELRADVIDLLAKTLDDPSSTPKIIAAGETQFRGFEGFETQSDADADPDNTVPVPLILTSVLDTEIESSPLSILIDQDADIEAADLLDPATQLWTDDDVDEDEDEGGLQFYTLRSSDGGVQLRPGKVVGSDLAVAALGADGTIIFDTDGGLNAVYELAAFDGGTASHWTVESAGGGTLTLEGENGVRLQSGNGGIGDLRFGTEVTLQGRQISLRAGPVLVPPTDPDDAPIVDAYTNRPDFILTKETDDDSTAFSIAQYGSIVTEGIRDAYGPRSIAPLARQFSLLVDGVDPGTGVPPVDFLEYESQLGDILLESIHDADGLQNTTRRVTLRAGELIDDPNDEGLIRIGPSGLETATGTVDLTSDAFTWFVTFSEAVELIARGTDAFVKAEGDFVRFFGPTGNTATSPPRFHVVQDEGFDESDPETGCNSGCLPKTRQFGGGLTTAALHVDYTIESTGGRILLDHILGSKLWESDLTLAAANVNGEEWDVKIALAHSPRVFIDIILNSLLVKEQGKDVGASTIDIVLSDDSSDENTTTLESPRVFVREDQDFYGEVRVEGEVELLGRNTTFHSTVDEARDSDDQTGEKDTSRLIIGAVGDVVFMKDVNLGAGTAGEETLLSVNFVPLDLAALPSVRFEKAGGEQTVTADTVSFEKVTDFDDTTPLLRVAALPTIKRPDGDLTFDTNEFRMGRGEKMTVVGNAVINAATSARLGDISALTIDVNSPRIEILSRPGGSYFDRLGVLQPDAGIDFVANTIAFNGDIILDTGITGYRKPVFGLERPLSAPDYLAPYPIAAINPEITALEARDMFDLNGRLLDMHPLGGSRDDISDIFFEDEMVPYPNLWIPSPWLVPDTAPMAELAIQMRPTRRSEHLSRLSGAPIIDDVGSDLLLDGEQSVTIAEARLSTLQAGRALEVYQRVFGEYGERTDHVRQVLQRSLDLYRRTSGASRVVGFELRRYVKNRPSTQFEAYETLEDLDLLFTYHRQLGLTPGEFRPIQHRWLAQIQPTGISVDELSEAIHPSRYVRGSDVLDIFGE